MAQCAVKPAGQLAIGEKGALLRVLSEELEGPSSTILKDVGHAAQIPSGTQNARYDGCPAPRTVQDVTASSRYYFSRALVFTALLQ